MTRLRMFQQVDVFTAEAYLGNPVAVVLDGEGLSTDEMQRFARWTNLSETTFVLAPSTPDADYRLRIFTTTRELPFAGHPTLGSCRAWLASGGVSASADVIVQECGAGLVRIRRDGERLAFAAPPLVRTGAVEPELISRITKLSAINPANIVEAQWVDNGPGWVGIMLANAEAVLSLPAPDLAGIALGVIGPYPVGSPFLFEVRAFYPDVQGTFEDPVTGSLNASLAQWLIGAGLAPSSYAVSQGTVLGRAGRVYVDRDPTTGDIWIGGDTVTAIAGRVTL